MREFSYDPLTGVRTQFEDLGDDGFALHTTQDVAGVLDDNKDKRNAGRAYYARDPDMWKAASIPVTIILKWLIEDKLDVYDPDHLERLKKKLNDPEWKYLKTGEFII